MREIYNIKLHIRTDLTRRLLNKRTEEDFTNDHKTSLSEFDVIGKVTISQRLSFYD